MRDLETSGSEWITAIALLAAIGIGAGIILAGSLPVGFALAFYVVSAVFLPVLAITALALLFKLIRAFIKVLWRLSVKSRL